MIEIIKNKQDKIETPFFFEFKKELFYVYFNTLNGRFPYIIVNIETGKCLNAFNTIEGIMEEYNIRKPLNVKIHID